METQTQSKGGDGKYLAGAKTAPALQNYAIPGNALMKGADCPMTGSPCPIGACGDGCGSDISNMLYANAPQGKTPAIDYAGMPKGKDTALPPMYISVQANPDGSYSAMAVIPDYTLQGENGAAFADYLKNGGIAEILSAMLPSASARATTGKPGKYAKN